MEALFGRLGGPSLSIRVRVPDRCSKCTGACAHASTLLEGNERGCSVRQEDLGQGGNPPEPQFPPLSNGDNKICPHYAVK